MSAVSTMGPNNGAWQTYRVHLPHAHLQEKDCIFELPTRYEPVKGIGAGAYGVVCSAKDTKHGRMVAIKKVNDVFSHKTDTKRLIRECKLLRAFDHYNIVPILDILPPKSWHFEDVYIISELMDTDLHRIIVSPQKLTHDHIRYFMYQILRGTKYMHSANVCHRDLKPSNLLLNKNCDLKICDFGLSRVVNATDPNEIFLTEYVATRWYRAPEVLLSWPRYTNAIDMWSIGCIFAELLGRKPLFPGSSYKQQVDMIIDVIGKPDEQTIQCIQSSRAQAYVRAIQAKPPVVWKAMFPAFDDVALDLLGKLLTFQPLNRYSVTDALRHPYFAALHDEDDEPGADGIQIDTAWETPTMNIQDLKQEMYNEIRMYHPGLPPWKTASSTPNPPAKPAPPVPPTAADTAAATNNGDDIMVDADDYAIHRQSLQRDSGQNLSLVGDDVHEMTNDPNAMDHNDEWRMSWANQ